MLRLLLLATALSCSGSSAWLWSCCVAFQGRASEGRLLGRDSVTAPGRTVCFPGPYGAPCRGRPRRLPAVHPTGRAGCPIQALRHRTAYRDAGRIPRIRERSRLGGGGPRAPRLQESYISGIYQVYTVKYMSSIYQVYDQMTRKV
jgi:hypothetical protein